MKVRAAKRFNREDFDETYEELIENIGEYLNTFNKDVYEALNRRLTINENLNQEIKTLTVSVNSEGLILPQLYIKPTVTPVQGLVVIKTMTTSGSGLTGTPYIDWELTSNGLIQINQIFGLSNSSEYTITVLIITE